GSQLTMPTAQRRRILFAGKPPALPSVLSGAEAYWKASQYSGSGALLDLSGHGHDAQLGSSAGADTNDPLFLAYAGTKYVYLPGSAGNYLSTPDAAPLHVAGDLDIRAKVALDDWTPANDQWIVGKLDQAATHIAYALRVDG